MKKFNLTFPPPPPPEAPKPEVMSPSNSGQQYSPSRATSPTSDEDASIPPPPSTASLPPRKVLGSDQAKRRLQAFAKAKFTNSPKGKSSMNFTDEEESPASASVVSKSERKRYPLVKEATPVMASIMKEETASREIVKKNMEKKNKNRDEVDLRDLLNLRKKREDEERSVGSRRSVSRERRGGGRSSSRSPRLKSSSDRGRRRDESLSPSPRPGANRRRSDKSSEDLFNNSIDEIVKKRRSSGSTKGPHSPNDSFGSEKRFSRSRDASTDRKKYKDDTESGRKRRSSGGSSLLSLDRSGSTSKEAQRKKEIKRNMPDLKDELSKEKMARKDVDLWELKHGGRDEENNDSPGKLFTVDTTNKNEMILIKANLDEDFQEVKKVSRDMSLLVSKKEGYFLNFPYKYMKHTKSGVCFSYNLEMSAESYKGEKRSAQLRKSIDSMMFELENETKRKRSVSGEKVEINSSKKKKKTKLDDKKVKKRKRTEEKSESFSKKNKKKTRSGKVNTKVETDEEKDSASETSPQSKRPKAASSQNVTLSAAGINKLFSMAGYTEADKETETKEKNVSTRKQETGFAESRREDKYSPSTPLQDDIEDGGSRSPSPSLIADLSRISDRQDEGPRMPKMKDSRSPSKIPIMRDGRSPITDEQDSFFSAERSHSPSPRKDSMIEDSPGVKYNPISGDRSPSGPRQLSPGVEDFLSKRPKSPSFARENSLSRSPGRKVRVGPRSPRRGRTPSPVRKEESRSRKSPQTERTRSFPTDSRQTPGRSPPPDRRRSPISDRGKRTPERTRSPRKSFTRSGRSPDQSRSPHDVMRSGRRTRSPYNQRRSPERTRSPGRGRSPASDRRRHRTPDRRRPTTPVSPRARSDCSPDGRKAVSPSSRRKRSPLYSPGRRSPEWRRRGPVSPGRPRYPRTPPYSPGARQRSRSPYDRRRGDRSPRGGDYGLSPDRRRRYSPRRRQNVPDSTISDAELARQLARQMPPPGAGYNKFRQLSPGYSDSPKRLSLDERLEREHGIKIDHQDPLSTLDFSRPPPSFPQPPGQFVTSVVPNQPPPQPQQPQPLQYQQQLHQQQQHQQQQSGGSTGSLFSMGLPAMIPTYDDTAPPMVMKGPPYPGSQKIVNEKEQAMLAANAVASKLQEMQAAKEDERKKKKEQKFAERIALMEAVQKPELTSSPVSVSKAASGRILEEVEKQETEMKDGDKKKRKKEKGSPMLITLKPFYRPSEKKTPKKKKCETEAAAEEEEEAEEEFTPRSPVPLPDNSELKPVLMKPRLRPSLDKKAVKYADGVLPGQGSPDQSFSPQPPPAQAEVRVKATKKKKYKKVVLTVITQSADTDSEEDPPPPPPGSPPRFPYKELLLKYGSRQPIETSA